MQEYKVTVDDFGTTRWYDSISGYYHRDGAPAITTSDGAEAWYQNGILHRNGGPAITARNGTRFWYQNGLKHREDGHAIEYADGAKHWYQNGLKHREDGHAIEYADGAKHWFLNGTQVTKQEFERRMNPKFKIGDKVTAPAYLGAWTNSTVININYCDEWPIQCVLPDGMTGIFRENELELITVKELTVEEISELLGYEVKVVEG